MSRTAPSARGDERRSALLAALDEHLQESSFSSISIADISRRAGVTRSAFYFYFDNKASAVAALMQEMYDAASVASDLLSADGDPAERFAAGVHQLFDAFDDHRHIYRSMLEARATSAAVRSMWDADRASFVPAISALITAERAAGRAPDGVSPDVLATLLLDLNDRVLERLALQGERDDNLTREQLVDGTVAIWLRTIYGGTP